MRAYWLLPTLALGTPAVAELSKTPPANCKPITPQIVRGEGLKPQRLDQLPPATPYMAVYRKIGGCDAPLTLSNYRRTKRR